MSGGVGGIGGSDSVPSIFPEDTVIIPAAEEPEVTPGVTVDPEPVFLTLSSAPGPNFGLPEGQFSLVEWSRIISEVIQQLREAITEAELLDAEKAREFHEGVLADIIDEINQYNEVIDQVNAWTTLLGARGVRESYDFLVQLTNELNALIAQTALNDVAAIQTVNVAIQTFNDPVAMSNLVASFGGNEAAARDYLIQQINNYNDYLASRPDLDAPLQELADLTDQYRAEIIRINGSITVVNQERAALGLTPISPPNLDNTPPVSRDITDFLEYEGTLDPIDLERNPPPNAIENLEAVYTDPLTSARIEVLRTALKGQAQNPTQEGWVDSAIATAQSGGPYSSEGAFFIAVKDAYVAFFANPAIGLQQFIFALSDVPVPIIAIPLPINVDVRLISYKTGVNSNSVETLRAAMKAQVTGGPARQQVDDAIDAAFSNATRPFATAGEFYAAVKVEYAALFMNPSVGEALFDQAILTIPLIDEERVPNLLTELHEIPPPVDPGEPPYVSESDAVAALWLDGFEAYLFGLTALTDVIDLAYAALEEEREFFIFTGANILDPAPFIEDARRLFLEGIAGIGSGVGLGGFAIGLQSRVLELALSSAALQGVSTAFRQPISGREFSRLRFTAMELLYRSSLLSSLPAARFLISRLGTLSVASPAIAIAIAEAIIIQVGGIVSSGLLRTLVNSNFNRRFRVLGFLSIGGLARFTRAVAATLSLSILSVALAQLGRRIGMPNLVGQFFAYGSGIPTIDLLVALTAGSRLIDVLDNPFSILFLKQTLTDILVYRRGFSSYTVGVLVNNAINNIILRGGYNTVSHLRAELINEFQRVGFSYFQANLLANETIALISGDLGVRYLNVAFGLNFDSSVIASSIANNVFGFDIGIATAMLSNAITRSLLYGGFGSRVRLQNELMERFQEFGLNRGDAYAVALQTIELVETIGLLVPLNRYPWVANILLSDPVLRSVAYGSGIVRQELVEDLEVRGLSNTQAELVADLVTSLAARTFARPGNLFERALEQAILRATGGGIFRSQREFRDQVFAELRAVGFNTNDALFLANSAANFGLTGTNISLFGISAARLSALNRSAVTRISEEFSISRRNAQEIFDAARSRAILRAPFSSEDQFRAILREEFQREVINRLGRYDGYAILDRAFADLAGPNTILSLSALTEQISAHLLGILRPDLGTRVAEELRDRILTTLFGGTTIDEIENVELRDPLSVLNQINIHVQRLAALDELRNQRFLERKLTELLRALMTPNAEVGFLLQSLMDNPSTLIGSLLVEKAKGEFLDIPI